MFPLSNFLKSEVKVIAKQCGLERLIHKKESTGICFVGNRDFKDFIKEVITFLYRTCKNLIKQILNFLQYITSKRGYFVDIDNNKVVGEHEGIHQWTIGQRCRLASFHQPYFVARKEVLSNTIYVASGHEHPALFSEKIFANNVNWLCDNPFKEPNSVLICRFRFQHTKPLVKCKVYQISPTNSGNLIISLDKPLRAVTPGQYGVFYSNSKCLGSARIISVETLNTTDSIKDLLITS